MKVISVIGQKGGSGKSTVAVHLAVCAEQAGLSAAIIDTDPQGSAHKWFERRSASTPGVVREIDADVLPHHLSVAAALQSCGKGCSVWSRLAMRRRPRVNQDVMLRRTRLGCWSGRLRSAGVAWWRASHWPVETAR